MASENWTDMLSVLSMSTEYFVTEPFISWVSNSMIYYNSYLKQVADIRVQKIGTHYRAIERRRMGEQASWKANNPNGITESDVEVKGADYQRAYLV